VKKAGGLRLWRVGGAKKEGTRPAREEGQGCVGF
jgi:hypothetical protein